MKKTILTLTFCAALMINQSCKKAQVATPETTQTETIDATINSNESYRYSIPAGDNTDTYNVVTSSSNGATVVIESTTTETSFVYTPAPNYSGTDAVTIANTNSDNNAEHHHGGKHPGGKHHHKNHGGCNSGAHESKHNITFNITVNAVTN